jgi:hypothetical protein
VRKQICAVHNSSVSLPSDHLGETARYVIVLGSTRVEGGLGVPWQICTRSTWAARRRLVL